MGGKDHGHRGTKKNRRGRMIDKLIKCMESKKLISVYTHMNSENFSLGFIDTMDKDFIRLRTLSNDGIYLGYELVRIDSIFRIDEDSLYDKKINYLAKHFKGRYSEITLKSDNDESSVIIDLLKESQNKKIVVSIDISNDNSGGIIGIIQRIDNDYVTILSLDEYGEEIEKSTLLIKDIASVSCGDKSLQIIQFLWENNFPRSHDV